MVGENRPHVHLRKQRLYVRAKSMQDGNDVFLLGTHKDLFRKPLESFPVLMKQEWYGPFEKLTQLVVNGFEKLLVGILLGGLDDLKGLPKVLTQGERLLELRLEIR